MKELFSQFLVFLIILLQLFLSRRKVKKIIVISLEKHKVSPQEMSKTLVSNLAKRKRQK